MLAQSPLRGGRVPRIQEIPTCAIALTCSQKFRALGEISRVEIPSLESSGQASTFGMTASDLCGTAYFAPILLVTQEGILAKETFVRIAVRNDGTYVMGMACSWLPNALSSMGGVCPLPGDQQRWLRRAPAIVAGITDHLWSVEELLSFRVPPPRWKPPKRRGCPSQAMKELVTQWGT